MQDRSTKDLQRRFEKPKIEYLMFKFHMTGKN